MVRSRKQDNNEEHVLVCLSSSPSNARVIETAAKMAQAFNSQFTALFVHSSDFDKISSSDKRRLQNHIHLAQKYGATIASAYGEDVSYQIAEFARLSKVTKIVIGRSKGSKYGWFKKTTLTEKLIENVPHIDMYIIPDNQSEYQKSKIQMPLIPSVNDILKTMFIIFSVTCIGIFLSQFYFSEANIITVYVLGVLLTSIFTQTPICNVIASLLSILVFNFFFTEPRFTLHAYDPGYPITITIMLIVSLITGTLANKLKNHAQQAAQSSYRTKLLFETNQLLQKAKSDKEMLDIIASQLLKLLNRDVIVYSENNDELSNGKIFTVSFEQNVNKLLSLGEKEIVEWVFTNKKKGGATTEYMPEALCIYYPIYMNDHIYGVVGICIHDQPLDSFENNVLLSILGECALAIDNHRNIKEKEATVILAENEKLKASLLRMISHDLRTPLTSISGNANNLIYNSKLMEEETKLHIYKDIHEDSIWLISLVENLLSITRLEEGKTHFNFSTQIIEDVVIEALQHIRRKEIKHEIILIPSKNIITAKMDAKLIIQVIVNLIENAIKYTPVDSKIYIEMEEDEEMAYIHIKDNGLGIKEDEKEKIFDMFYCGNQKIADSRRSLGLGLPLCKTIMQAHKGEITLQDNIPHGCIFTCKLKKEEVILHE